MRLLTLNNIWNRQRKLNRIAKLLIALIYASVLCTFVVLMAFGGMSNKNLFFENFYASLLISLGITSIILTIVYWLTIYKVEKSILNGNIIIKKVKCKKLISDGKKHKILDTEDNEYNISEEDFNVIQANDEIYMVFRKDKPRFIGAYPARLYTLQDDWKVEV